MRTSTSILSSPTCSRCTRHVSGCRPSIQPRLPVPPLAYKLLAVLALVRSVPVAMLRRARDSRPTNNGRLITTPRQSCPATKMRLSSHSRRLWIVQQLLHPPSNLLAILITLLLAMLRAIWLQHLLDTWVGPVSTPFSAFRARRSTKACNILLVWLLPVPKAPLARAEMPCPHRPRPGSILSKACR